MPWISFLLTLLLCSGTILSSACSCDYYQRNIEKFQLSQREYAEHIFIARTYPSDSVERFCQLEVIEVFKGNLTKGQWITGGYYDNCGPVIVAHQTWLIYSQKGYPIIQPITCGISRSFEYPERFPIHIHNPMYLPPLLPELPYDQQNRTLRKKAYFRERAKIIMQQEIEALRQYAREQQKSNAGQ